LISVIVRVLTLIVSAALVIGAATQLGWAFDDDTAGYSIDDDPPVDPAAMPTTTTTILARRHQAAPVVWDVVASPGRLHAVSVFRPPRA
jgi:hypothetical protein